MKRQRFFKLALLLAVPLALFAYVAYLNSWRPKTIEFRRFSVGSVTFSPDGRYLLVAANRGSHEITICDVGSRKIIATIKTSTFPRFLGNGKQLAVTTNGSVMPWVTRILSFPELQPLKQQPFTNYIEYFKVAWPDQENLVRQDFDGNIFLWNIRTDVTKKITLPLPAPAKGYFRMEFFPDNKTVMLHEHNLTGWFYPGRPVQFWDIDTKKCRFVVNDVYIVPEFAASSAGICALSRGNGVEIWNYFTGQRKRVLKGTILKPCLSPDGAILAALTDYDAADKRPTVTLWDTFSGQRLRVLLCLNEQIMDLAFSPDGRTLAVGGDGFVQLWRVK